MVSLGEISITTCAGTMVDASALVAAARMSAAVSAPPLLALQKTVALSVAVTTTCAESLLTCCTLVTWMVGGVVSAQRHSHSSCHHTASCHVKHPTALTDVHRCRHNLALATERIRAGARHTCVTRCDHQWHGICNVHGCRCGGSTNGGRTGHGGGEHDTIQLHWLRH